MALEAEVNRLGSVRWHWVRGHETGAEHAHKALNDRADQLAVAAAKPLARPPGAQLAAASSVATARARRARAAPATRSIRIASATIASVTPWSGRETTVISSPAAELALADDPQVGAGPAGLARSA